MSKQINLRIPDAMYRKLKAQPALYAYTSIQEVIIDALREKYFRQSRVTGGKRGRPRKINEFRIMARKRIFSKHGEPIEI